MIDEEQLIGRDELLRVLEETSGRPLRSRIAVRAYPAEGWRTAKVVTLGVLGAFALLQYYLLDVLVQVAAMPHITVFVRAGQLLAQ